MIANQAPKVKPGDVADVLYRLFTERVREYAMIFLDKNGIVSSWNDGAEIMKGYRPEEIVGKHFSAFYSKADVENRKPQFELQVATMEGRSEEEGWRYRMDGSTFWASVVITAIKDVDGTLLGFAKITRDLTERKHHEEEVRQSEERFRLLVHAVKDYAIFMLDPKGRVLTWNEGAKRIKGYEADEIVGRSLSTFYTPEDRERRHPEEFLHKAEREGRAEEEGWRVRKDGSKFRARVTLTAMRGADGKLQGFAKVTRDLTPA